jgi:hypothetical protein
VWLEASLQDRDKIVDHVSSVELARQEQIEAENTLHALLALKEKFTTQNRLALRMLVTSTHFFP